MALLYISFFFHVAWVVLGFFALMSWRRLREVGHLADTPIFNLRAGVEARVRGRTAFHGAERRSPIGGVAAVWCDWLVQRDADPLRELDRGPIALSVGTTIEPFALVDAGGYRVLVFPEKAELVEPRKQEWREEFPAMLDATLRDRIERGVDQPVAVDDSRVLHFTERWLPAGVQCFVVGLVEAPGPEHGPEVHGVIRARGEGDFLISAGAPDEALAKLHRQMIYGTIGAAVAFVAAVALMILA